MITRELRISLAVIRISAFSGIVMVGNALGDFASTEKLRLSNFRVAHDAEAIAKHCGALI